MIIESVNGHLFINGQAEGRYELEAALVKLAAHLGYQLSQYAPLSRFQHALDRSHRL